MDRTRHLLVTPNRTRIDLSASEVVLLASILAEPSRQLTREALLQAFEAAGAADGRPSPGGAGQPAAPQGRRSKMAGPSRATAAAFSFWAKRD